MSDTVSDALYALTSLILMTKYGVVTGYRGVLRDKEICPRHSKQQRWDWS